MSSFGASQKLAERELKRRRAIAAAATLSDTNRMALLAFSAALAVAATMVLAGGTLVGQDSATQFYPWYDYLGERLRAGDIPAWNPYQLGGAPFAADPQSGWTYLPAMLLFTWLPLSEAVAAFIVAHLALAGFGSYALARRLDIAPGGALVAAVAYAFAGPLLGRSVCCPAAFEVASWTPTVLLGAAVATEATNWRARFAGWALAGLAVSQALAAWMGQGAYYVLLALGAFVAWRTLLAPPARARRWSARLSSAAQHGGAILAIGFGLAAASVLPRLDYIARSNVAGGEYTGYSEWAAEIGGIEPGTTLQRVLEPTLHNPGSAAVALAVMALLLTLRTRGAPFFVPFGLGALILATPFTTPLHLALYAVLPRFQELHQHWPERVGIVGYIAFAVLAGASADALGRDQLSSRRVHVAAALPLAALGLLLAAGSSMPAVPVLSLVAIAILVVLCASPAARELRAAVPVALAVIVAFDLLWSFHGVTSRAPYGGFHRVDLDSYYAETGAVAFLRQQRAHELGRYIGFNPAQLAVADGQTTLYRFQFVSRSTAALLVNNRGTLYRLEDAQGYNPVQSQRYVEYLTALNGHPQEYHDANVYRGGLDSPLLDLLNVRYVVIPMAPTGDRPDLEALTLEYPVMYSDEHVRILENPQALPRAWVVHNARQVSGREALGLLASGEVDPRRVALLEDTPPPLAPTADPTGEVVEVVEHEPERLTLTTLTDADGLLVLSEVYDPGWRVYIDGERAPLMVANHLLRATPLPAGSHTVEFRYEPATLRVGLIISAVTVLAVLSGLVVATWRGRGCREAQPATTER